MQLPAKFSIAPCKKNRVSVRSPIVSPMPLTDRFATACVLSRACRDRGPCKPCRDSRVGVFACRDRGRVSRVGVFACRSCFSWWKLAVWAFLLYWLPGAVSAVFVLFAVLAVSCWPCRVGTAVSGQPCRVVQRCAFVPGPVCRAATAVFGAYRVITGQCCWI